MSLKDLEKYQETGRRTPLDFDYPDQQETKEQEQARLEKIKKARINIVTVNKSLNWNIVIDRISEEALQEECDNKDNFYDNDNELDYLINHR